MSNGDIARAAFLKQLDRFREVEELNARLVAVEQRGNGSQAEREDLRRNLDRERLLVVWNLLSALFACEETDLR